MMALKREIQSRISTALPGFCSEGFSALRPKTQATVLQQEQLARRLALWRGLDMMRA
jgi:hypothetical protein